MSLASAASVASAAAAFAVPIPAPVASSTLTSVVVTWSLCDYGALSVPSVTIAATWSVTRGLGQWAVTANESMMMTQAVRHWLPSDTAVKQLEFVLGFKNAAQANGYSIAGWASVLLVVVNSGA